MSKCWKLSKTKTANPGEAARLRPFRAGLHFAADGNAGGPGELAVSRAPILALPIFRNGVGSCAAILIVLDVSGGLTRFPQALAKELS